MSFNGILFSLQYFWGLIITFKKNGSIELYIVIIDTSHIHGIINVTKGLLLINWCTDGTKETFSLLNEGEGMLDYIYLTYIEVWGYFWKNQNLII